MSHSYKGSYRLVFSGVEDAYACSVCGYVLKDDKDLKTFFEKGACTSCVDIYYYPNAQRWESGWRPNRDEVRKNDVQRK